MENEIKLFACVFVCTCVYTVNDPLLIFLQFDLVSSSLHLYMANM